MTTAASLPEADDSATQIFKHELEQLFLADPRRVAEWLPAWERLKAAGLAIEIIPAVTGDLFGVYLVPSARLRALYTVIHLRHVLDLPTGEVAV